MTLLQEHLHDDFSKSVAVSIGALEWVPSPVPGVLRRPLDRVGGEVARATSVVRFLPNYHFEAHTHGGGEEYLVLDGVFSDESGDYGALTYVRNAPGSAHKPFSREGCEIFVKLHQMKPQGENSVIVHSKELDWQPVKTLPGVFEKVLFKATDWYEEVALMKITPEAPPTDLSFVEGGEILLLDGALLVDGQLHEAMSWLRFPDKACARIEARSGALFWIKKGIDFLAAPI